MLYKCNSCGEECNDDYPVIKCSKCHDFCHVVTENKNRPCVECGVCFKPDHWEFDICPVCAEKTRVSLGLRDLLKREI